jgi:hypothetical protein
MCREWTIEIGETASMRFLRIILIPVVPGLFAFCYIWVVDGGGDFFTCVPRFFAELIAGATDMNVSLLRRMLIPGYLLLFVFLLVAYSLRPKRGWLQALGVLGLLHLILVGGIVLQDD